MYRILLVDDEPLMLSGIKRLLNWEKNGCQIAGSASGYAEALEKLAHLRPDIVICDIVMPGRSGLDILKQAEQDFPDTVFIMLSNHAEFEMAQESLHHQALEYLLKTNLEPKALETTLARAIAERENRNKLHRVEKADEFLVAGQRQDRICSAVARLLEKNAPMLPHDETLLKEEGMLSGFAFESILLNFAVLSDSPDFSEEERRKIIEWEMEIAEHLGASFFPHVLLFPRSPKGARSDTEGLLLFAWGLTAEQWEAGAQRFRDRLVKTSEQIVRLAVEALPSAFYETVNAEESPADSLARMEEQHFSSKRSKHVDILKKARQYILSNVERRIMLQEIANYVYISPGYLSSLFRKIYHQNLVDFINQTKIERACELLRENKHRINEISAKLGFDSAFYFTRVFHRRTGLTPSEYQAKIQGMTDEMWNIMKNAAGGGGGG
jgi:YesN/AraC family two-component response regulator